MITLDEIMLQARQRSDMEHSNLVSDSELTAYVNASLAELHDLLISSYNEDYIMESTQFTTTDGLELSYDLPSDFYKLRGVDVQIGSDWMTVKRFNFNRRNEDSSGYAWNILGSPYLEYRLVGSQIRFNRAPQTGTTFRVWYHPVVTKLVSGTDSYNDINGFIEYVVVDCAIKMLQKEESDVAVLMAQKEALRQRIVAMAQNRDANEPESITDIYAEGDGRYWLTRS